MPWKPSGAKHKDKAANTPKKAREWAHIADSVLKRTGNEGLAIREASGVLKKQPPLGMGRKK